MDGVFPGESDSPQDLEARSRSEDVRLRGQAYRGDRVGKSRLIAQSARMCRVGHCGGGALYVRLHVSAKVLHRLELSDRPTELFAPGGVLDGHVQTPPCRPKRFGRH